MGKTTDRRKAPRLAWLALLCALLGAPGPTAAQVRPWVIPPLDGELAGEFTPLILPGAPPVKWRVKVASTESRVRVVTGELDGPGLKVRGGAVLDPRGEGTWRLAEAVIDLNEWFGWVAGRFAPAAFGGTLGGTLLIHGEGTWRAGRLEGRAEVEWREGRYDDPAHNVVVEGLALRFSVEDLPARRSAAAQVLTWQGGHYATVPFGPGRVEFALDGDTVRLGSATLGIFGGELIVGPMTVLLSKPEMAVTAQMKGIELQQMLFLLPPVLAAAQGRLDGRIALQQSDAGIQIGAGHLSLRPGDTADIRFAPSPGLLSASLPPAVRQHYPGLGQLESGGIPLRAETFEVILTPQGDAEGRTASVRIAGGPADPTLKAPVVLQVNVRGPVDSLVQFGSNSKLHFGK